MTFEQYWATVTTGTWRDEPGARAAFKAGMLRAAEIARARAEFYSVRGPLSVQTVVEKTAEACCLDLGDAIEREARPATPSTPTSEGEETGK